MLVLQYVVELTDDGVPECNINFPLEHLPEKGVTTGKRSNDHPAKSPLNLTGTQDITSKQVSKFSETFY